MRGSHLVTLPDKVEDLIIVVNKLLFKASYLNCVRFVLSELKLMVLIQKIVYFAAVDLVHWHCDGEVPLVILPIVDAPFEKIFDGNALNAIHCVRLTWSGLTVGKDGYYSLIENQVEDGSYLIEIELFIWFVLAERIIKFELRVFNCFGDAVYFVLAVVDVYFWVSNRDYIDLSVRKLLLEYGPLFEAHTDFHLIGKDVLLLTWQFFLFMLYHGLEIHIYFDALQLIISLTLAL